MNPVKRTSRRFSVSSACLAVAALLAACEAPEPPPSPDVYEIRGEVIQLPGARPGAQLLVRHETVPDFKNADGEAVGMHSMTMPFSVADKELLDRIYVGDKVAFTLEVRWQARNPLVITGIEKLPPDTPLEFEDLPEDPAPEDAGVEGSETPAGENAN